MVWHMNAVRISRSSLPWLLAVSLGCLLTGCSTNRQATAHNADTEKGGAYLTGSYLKQDFTRNGEITNGKNNVRVLDEEKIDQSGASDVNQFLRLSGVH